MFIFLSKFLPLLIYPLGVIFLLIILALLTRNKPKWQAVCLGLALILLLLSSNRWVALSLTKSLEWRYLPPDDIPQADVIVVLAGGTQAAQYPRQTPEINGAGDRLIYAAQLYHQGTSSLLLLTGGRIDWLSPGPSPTEEMADILEMLGVPRDAMIFESTSRNTYENATHTRVILEQMDVNRVILVTSADHMPRSVALFEHQGIDVIPAPTDFTVTENNWEQLFHGSVGSQLLNLIPNSENLSLTTGALKEYLGIIIYRLRGWL